MVCDSVLVLQGIIRVRYYGARRLSYALAIASYSRQDICVCGSSILRRLIGHVYYREAGSRCDLRYVYSQARVEGYSGVLGTIALLLR